MEKKNLIVQMWAPSAEGHEGRIGTAYPVAPGVLMTAAHVVGDATGNTIEARWWHLPDGERTWKHCTKILWDGRTQSPSSDIVLLGCEFPTSVTGHWGQFAAVRPKDHAEWCSEGFPYVGVKDENAVPIKGTTHSMGDRSEHFHLAIDAATETEEGWTGASGSPVFVNDRIIGVIVNSPRDYRAERFHAVPVFRLLENPEFRSLVNYSAAEDQRHQLKEAAISELASCDEAMAILVKQLRIDPPADRQKRASAIVTALLDDADPVKLANRVVRSMQQVKGREEPHQRAVATLNAVAMHLIPASLAMHHIPQIHVIAESGSQQHHFQACTKTFLEIAMARLDGRPALYRTPRSQRDRPPGILSLEKPAEVEIDKTGEEFKRNFVKGLRDAMAMPDLGDPELEKAVAAINDELELRRDLGEGLHYYVYSLSANDDQRQRCVPIIRDLAELFPLLRFIPLESTKASKEENQSVSLLLRILCRAAGIEWKIDGQDEAS